VAGGAYLSEWYNMEEARFFIIVVSFLRNRKPLQYSDGFAFIMAKKDVDEVDVTFCSSVLGCHRKLLLYLFSQSSPYCKELRLRRW
jgi:hypothetical protein